jgi:hypothetical protein
MSGKWQYTKSIDPKSIMMYHDSAKGILEGALTTRAEDLSQHDIEAVKAVYVEEKPEMWQCYPWKQREGKNQQTAYNKRKPPAGEKAKAKDSPF